MTWVYPLHFSQAWVRGFHPNFFWNADFSPIHPPEGWDFFFFLPRIVGSTLCAPEDYGFLSIFSPWLRFSPFIFLRVEGLSFILLRTVNPPSIWVPFPFSPLFWELEVSSFGYLMVGVLSLCPHGALGPLSIFPRAKSSPLFFLWEIKLSTFNLLKADNFTICPPRDRGFSPYCPLKGWGFPLCFTEDCASSSLLTWVLEALFPFSQRLKVSPSVH